MLGYGLIAVGLFLALYEILDEGGKNERSGKKGADRTGSRGSGRKRTGHKKHHGRGSIKNDGNIQQKQLDNVGNRAGNDSTGEPGSGAKKRREAKRPKLIAGSKKKVKAILAKRKEKKESTE